MNAKTRTIAIASLCAALATSAFAAPYEIGGADNSMSRFGGDGYAYFHESTPAGSYAVTPFRATNPTGLPEAAYAAYSSEDPVWQPKVVIVKSTPAADPVARPRTVAQEKTFFAAEDRFLQSHSTP